MVILNFLLGWLIPVTAFLIGFPLAIRELWRHEREVAAGKWSLKEDREQEPDADVLVLKVRGSRVTFWTASSAVFGPVDLN